MNPEKKQIKMSAKSKKQIKQLEKERDQGYKKIAALQLQINKESKYIELIQKEIIKLKERK